MYRNIGIIGYPLGHSISPVFQQAALDHYSIPARYHAWSTPPDKLIDQVAKLREEHCIGANFTIPHKERVIDLLDEVDSSAISVGAVNTVVNREGSLFGYNTDVYGILTSLKQKAGFDPIGKTVILVGAGGAARAAAYALGSEGVASMTIVNRTLARAQSLATDMRCYLKSVTAIGFCGPNLSIACETADLIINATSMGMTGGPKYGDISLQLGMVPDSALVFDMVYSPTNTPLLINASRAGLRTMGGLPMLIYQGAASFEMWTSKQAPIDVMTDAAEREMVVHADYDK